MHTIPRGPTSATSTQSIGTGGGTASVNFGIYTATVTVPAGALPSTTTVSITLYGTGHGPQTLKSARRSARSLGAGSVELAEVAIDTGGVAPVLPLKLGLIGVAAPISGVTIRLAGYGTVSGFNDVDTVTLTGATASEDDSILYPGASLASNTLYGFYELPTANVTKPPTPVIAISGTNPAPSATSTQYTASETDGNGFPFLITAITFALDNPALGTLSASGLLSTGALDAQGTITATDSTPGRGSPTGTLAVGVASSRPGATGDAFSFKGTISSTTQLTGPTVTQPQTDAGSVTLAVSDGATSVAGSTATVTSTSTEVDTYPRQTITTNTTSQNAYGLASSGATVSVVSTDATDSNGAEFINTYGSGNGLLDVLPETAGTFGPNNAALVYQENDPANYSRTRTIAANGSYVEMGSDSFGDVQTITTNADLSAAYDASQYSGRVFAYSKPAGTPAMITITYTRAPNPPVTIVIQSWIPVTATQPSIETDVDNGSVALPAACAVNAKYGTTGNQLVQTIKRVDPALGNLETETLTTYVVPLYGPLCTVMTDHVQTYYDYTVQYGNGLTYSATGMPLELTDIAETLTLQSATTSAGTKALKRQTASTSAASSRSAYHSLAFARARFERTVREHLKNRNPINRGFSASGAHAK